MLGVQTLGVVAVAAWVAITMTVLFFIIKKTIGLRVSASEEIAGLDIEEHGLISSYADFMPAISEQVNTKVGIDEAVSVELKTITVPNESSSVKMTKLEIITNPAKFDLLKASMNSIGVTGMTVTNVLGCGMQRGQKEYYRGIEVEVNLLPKISVEIVVCKVPIKKVIDAAKKALYTGKIGDGKIFVYNVENAIKVRTGEEGYDALQDN